MERFKVIDIPHLEWHVTHSCNFTCQGCGHFTNDGYREDFTVDELKSWYLPWIDKIRPRELSILGGEPLLNKDIIEIIYMTKEIWSIESDQVFELVTNALLIDKHPDLPNLNYISFCQFMEPVTFDHNGLKNALNTVVIRPGKLDRSPCGTGTSARLALLRYKKEIEIGEKILFKSIIGSTFEAFVEKEIVKNNKNFIVPNIKGSAFVTGEQILYKDDRDPFPEGYRLNDTWPEIEK